jgi:hypothetical protein
MTIGTRFAAAALSLAIADASIGAQVADPRAVQPERPTVATHAGTVAPSILEIETGVERDRPGSGITSFNSVTEFKIGLADRVQLNLYAPVVRPSESSSRIGDFAMGVKWRIREGVPILGKLAVLPTVKLPTGSESNDAGTGTTDLGLLLISSQTLGPVELDMNFGYTRRFGTDTIAPRDATLWTVSFGGPAVGNLGWVTECFAYPATSGPAKQASTVAVLAGPTLLARPWWSFDLGVIVPVRGPQPHALYVGTVFNVGPLWARTP